MVGGCVVVVTLPGAVVVVVGGNVVVVVVVVVVVLVVLVAVEVLVVDEVVVDDALHKDSALDGVAVAGVEASSNPITSALDEPSAPATRQILDAEVRLTDPIYCAASIALGRSHT